MLGLLRMTLGMGAKLLGAASRAGWFVVLRNGDQVITRAGDSIILSR